MQKGFIFDLDGTVYIDNQLIDGAAEAIKELKERGDKVVFLTNKSIETVSAYVEKLTKLGITVTRENVINSNFLVARYLASRISSEEKVMVIGEQPLLDELTNMGISISDDETEVSYVVLGWDREFTYAKLNRAFQAWRNGAIVVATNPDRTCPVEGGQIPDCGAMIGAMEGATGEKVELILGKPSPLAAKFIVEDILNLPPENCYMVGDRLETDIRMGNDCGLQSVLVLTGITEKGMLEHTQHQPKYVLNSISEIPEITRYSDSKALDHLKK
ncbi:HAD-IIA family hydrolase [Ornithinibacillus bavariensis]|uniref:Acid sugar phosphatase n=1 Tax=Ornithinibacillus bavariensis TaxID=545502 RepID=A0A919XAB6_9BACI|nr:HAD-IIA family hydrolase [Ornithinibacillus bavariensis]GIO27020.1 haloacid dehalogenase [Ornithinibacillus bavariensis]